MSVWNLKKTRSIVWLNLDVNYEFFFQKETKVGDFEYLKLPVRKLLNLLNDTNF